MDPLGFYLPPFNYAIGQLLAAAVTATKSLDHKILAKYLRQNEIKTVVGNIRFGPTGEWATPRIFYLQFRGPGKQVIIAPDGFKTGEVLPFSQGPN